MTLFRQPEGCRVFLARRNDKLKFVGLFRSLSSPDGGLSRKDDKLKFVGHLRNAGQRFPFYTLHTRASGVSAPFAKPLRRMHVIIANGDVIAPVPAQGTHRQGPRGDQLQKMRNEVRRSGAATPSIGERSSDRFIAPPSLIDEVNERKRSAHSPSGVHRLTTPAEFNTAMIHFYRGEVQRSNTWRNRLDTTTNWAVLTAAGTLSFAFSSSNNPHFVIPINSLLVAIFLVMEARRYRYYEIWSSRVRVLETGYFAQMLSPENAPVDSSWAEHLASDLLTPHFTISEWEAIGRRLRRNYLWIFVLLALSWNLKVYLHPLPARDLETFMDRATVGLVPGWIVVLSGFVFNAAVLIFAAATVRLREATGEVLARHQFSLRPLQRISNLTRAAANVRQRTTRRRAKEARHRVKTSSTTTGEFKRIDISETPDRKVSSEEPVLR